jgi:peptidoglycan DL-endopeptidase CwlO
MLAGVVAGLSAAALVVPALAVAAPDTPASPATVSSVQQQLGDLALKNAQLVEQYDQVQSDVVSRKAAAARAQQVATVTEAEFGQARDQLAATVVAQYEGGAFSATGALLSSDSGQSYLDRLATLSMISTHNAQLVTNLTVAKKHADVATEQAQVLLADETAKRDALAKQRTNVQAQIDKYQTLLGTLTAAQRAAFIERVSPTADVAVSTLNVHATSAAAARAVQFAIAQVGKPYAFGAAGPDSYDCSGLTMAAWAAAGVSLPHLASGQYGYGTHVAFDQLQPGDLLFYGSPAHHVTIYIGSGYMISAPQSGELVKVMPADAMSSEFSGATRLVG